MIISVSLNVQIVSLLRLYPMVSSSRMFVKTQGKECVKGICSTGGQGRLADHGRVGVDLFPRNF